MRLSRACLDFAKRTAGRNLPQSDRTAVVFHYMIIEPVFTHCADATHVRRLASGEPRTLCSKKVKKKSQNGSLGHHLPPLQRLSARQPSNYPFHLSKLDTLVLSPSSTIRTTINPIWARKTHRVRASCAVPSLSRAQLARSSSSPRANVAIVGFVSSTCLTWYRSLCLPLPPFLQSQRVAGSRRTEHWKRRHSGKPSKKVRLFVFCAPCAATSYNPPSRLP